MPAAAAEQLSAFLASERNRVRTRFRRELRARAHVLAPGELEVELEPLVDELRGVLRDRPDEAPAVFGQLAAASARRRFQLGVSARQAVRELAALHDAVLAVWAQRRGPLPEAVARLLAAVLSEAAAQVAQAASDLSAQAAPLEEEVAVLRERDVHREAALSRTERELQALQARLLRLTHDRAMSDVAAGTGLALNNELNALALSLRLLRAELPPGTPPRHLDAIEVAVRRAADLVARLQQIGARRSHGAARPLDLNALVLDTIDLVRPELTAAVEDKAVRVDAQLGELPPVLARGPELRDLLSKLLVNVRDAMLPGAVLAVTTRRVRDHAELTLTALADAGPDAPEREVVRELAVRAGGELDIDATGDHLRVRLTLPLAPEEAGREAEPRRAPRPMQRILVVDDDAGNRETLSELLTLSGHDVHDAGSSDEALRLVERHTFDAALLDLAMPGMNGIELAERLRAIHPDLRIALVTGWDPSATPPLPTGVVDEVFRKPIDLRAIEAFLQPEDAAARPH